MNFTALTKHYTIAGRKQKVRNALLHFSDLSERKPHGFHTVGVVQDVIWEIFGKYWWFCNTM